MTTPVRPLSRLVARLSDELSRRGKLVDRALRDPAGFLADARAPFLRQMGALAAAQGLFPATSTPSGPRGLVHGHRDPGEAHAPVLRGALSAVEGNRLRGFAEASEPHARLVALVDGAPVASFVAAQRSADGAPRTAFDVCVDLTDRAVDVDEVTLRVVCDVSGRDLDGSPRRVRVPRYEGAIVRAAHGRVLGHVRDVATGATVHIDVLVAGRNVARISVPSRGRRPPRWSCAFAARYAPRADDESFELRVRGTTRPLLGTPTPLPERSADRPPVKKALETMRGARGAAPNGCVLMVTHHLGGGVEAHVQDLAARLTAEGVLVLTLSSHEDGTTRLCGAGAEAVYGAQQDALIADLRALSPNAVHLHAWLTFPPSYEDLPRALGVPYDVTLHEFFVTCPRLNFVRAEGEYCGEPDVHDCELCIAVDGPHEAARFFETAGRTVAEHRARERALLLGARRLFAPSHDTSMRVQRALGSLPIRVLAHPERAAEVRFLETKTERVRVAVLGGIGLHKGYRALLDLARHAHAASLPLDIVVFGTTIDSGSLRALPNVTITGRYTRDSLPALVSAHGCTVAVFLSIWPETFSYTLSEALSLGLRPLVFDIGAPAERLRAFGHGRIVPTTASAAELASEILSLSRAPMPEVVKGPFTDYPSILRDYYERER